LRQYSFAKKIQTKTVGTEKLHNIHFLPKKRCS
jgi:hypothetical protein